MLHLKNPHLLTPFPFINGEWINCDEQFDVSNPSDQKVISSVGDAGLWGIEKAITSAHCAKKKWAQKTAKERSQILKKIATLLTENSDDLATILSSENGKPLSEARKEVLYGASYFDWFSEEAKRLYGDIIPMPTRDKRIMVIKQPVGVVAAITPWNFPNAMIARKIAPALATGCTVVLRPSELTPLSALAIGKIAQQAGLPDGVLNIVPTYAPEAAGELLCASPKVAKVTFTGSTRVGKILMKNCSDHIKKMSLELGGNAPFVVFEDADIDLAVEGAMASKFRNSGQTCVCANRIYVQSSIYERFKEKLSHKISALSVGDAFAPNIDTGPLIDQEAILKVERHIRDAVSLGAKVDVGGQKHGLGGTYFQPTLLSNVTHNMLIAHEETFGPIAPLIKFETEEEVLDMANDSNVGLAGYFYTQDISRAFRFGEALEVGMVAINAGSISSETVPFGGVKESGLGREGSKYGCDEFTEIKTMCFGNI